MHHDNYLHVTYVVASVMSSKDSVSYAGGLCGFCANTEAFYRRGWNTYGLWYMEVLDSNEIKDGCLLKTR